MPTYNAEKYVKDAINSILNQTYKDLELIVINDCSKDNSREVIQSIKDDRLVFVDNEENHGFLWGLNHGIEIAKGGFIARLDDDDLSYPTRIEKQVKFLDDNPEVVLVGTMTDITENGAITPATKRPIETREQLRFSLLFNNYCISHSSFMMRKTVLEANDIHYETFKQVPDYHMQTQMLEVGDLDYIKETLVTYRIHPTQSTAVRSAQMKTGEFDRAKIWYLNRLKISDDMKAAIRKALLRKIRTKEEVKDFAEAFLEYAKVCGLDVDGADNETVSYVFKDMIGQQYRCPGLYSGCKEAEAQKLLRGEYSSFSFFIKCLIRRNKYYVESEL